MSVFSHSLRVASLSAALAEALGLCPWEAFLAGLFHDVGKSSIPKRVLEKPGPLDVSEWLSVLNHSIEGAGLLRRLGFPSRVVEAVMCHHEDFSGSGYPRGLKGSEIPPLARVLRVADAYDAMVSRRPYRGPISSEQALSELRRFSGSLFDPEVVSALCRLFESSEARPRRLRVAGGSR